MVTVRRVAAESGTTTRAVYSLFGGKDGMLRALFRKVSETMRRLENAEASEPTDALTPHDLHTISAQYP